MREIGDYGGVDFGPVSLHLKDGDPNDMPYGSVLDIVERWGEWIEHGCPPSMLKTEEVEDRWGHIWQVQKPSAADLAKKQVVVQYLKTRPPSPIKFKTTFQFGSINPATRRKIDEQRGWWRRFLD